MVTTPPQLPLKQTLESHVVNPLKCNQLMWASFNLTDPDPAKWGPASELSSKIWCLVLSGDNLVASRRNNKLMLLCREPEVLQNGSRLPPCGHCLVVLQGVPCGLNKPPAASGRSGGLLYSRPMFVVCSQHERDISVCVNEIILTPPLIDDGGLNLRQILL